MSSQMTRSFFLACFFAVSLEVSAQPAARVFAVVSLIGDNLDVVTHQPATGTVADRNVHDLIPVKDLAFDKFAILAVEDAVKLSQPGAQVKLFAPTAPELFREQERFFVDRKAALPADLLAGLQKAAATHLLMITKFRAPTQIAIKRHVSVLPDAGTVIHQADHPHQRMLRDRVETIERVERRHLAAQMQIML